MTTPAAAPASDRSSLFEDFIDIIFSPAKVYARRATSGFWVPLLIISVLTGALFFGNYGTMESMLRGESERRVAKMIEANPSEAAQIQERMTSARGIEEVMSKVVGFIIMVPLVMIVALVVLLVGKLFDAALTFRAAAVITTWAYVPKVIEQLGIALQGILLDTSALRGRYQLTLGAGRMLDPDTTAPWLVSFLGRVDLFTIWVTVLIGIGISVIGKVPRARAMMAAALIWVVGSAFALWELVMG